MQIYLKLQVSLKLHVKKKAGAEYNFLCVPASFVDIMVKQLHTFRKRQYLTIFLFKGG